MEIPWIQIAFAAVATLLLVIIDKLSTLKRALDCVHDKVHSTPSFSKKDSKKLARRIAEELSQSLDEADDSLGEEFAEFDDRLLEAEIALKECQIGIKMFKEVMGSMKEHEESINGAFMNQRDYDTKADYPGRTIKPIVTTSIADAGAAIDTFLLWEDVDISKKITIHIYPENKGEILTQVLYHPKKTEKKTEQ